MPRILVSLVLLLVANVAAAGDITVGWISRLPEIDYVRNSSNPRVEGWPAAGDVVTWRANVRNFGTPHDDVAYRWTIDGRTVGTGNVSLAGDSITTADLPWTWTFERHRIGFIIDDTKAVPEESETNNSLEVFSDAIAAGFWVEQSLYDYFRSNQARLGIGSTCWDNWAQRHADYFNDMAALAVYPETPGGVLDRWRIQKIVVVPDGALPLAPIEGVKNDSGESNGASHPNIADRSVDLMWGFRKVTLSTYANTTSADMSNPFYLAPVLIHELGHARYLTDLYGWNVRNQPPGYRIDITENGASILGTYVPGTWYVFYTPEQGLMSEQFTFIDHYSAINLNQVAGMRARQGNYNDPDDVGSFLNDLPAENRLTIRDPFGNLIAGANIRIYQSIGDAKAWYATHYDDVPDLERSTDANGQVLIGRCPFSKDGTIINYFGGSNTVAIVRAQKDGQVLYGFLESRLFNLAHWRGETAFADHDLVVGAGILCSNRGPVLRAPAWDARTGSNVTLEWDAIPNAKSYEVWVSSDLGAPHVIATTRSTSVDVHLNGRIYWWVEARGDSCMPRRSDPSRLNAPTAASRRRAVGRY